MVDDVEDVGRVDTGCWVVVVATEEPFSDEAAHEARQNAMITVLMTRVETRE